MKTFKSFFNTALLLCLCLVPSRAVPDETRPITLADDTTYEFVTHNAEFLQDDDGSLTASDVASPDKARAFKKINSEGFLSKKNPVVWLRFSLENRSGTQGKWLLEYDYFKNDIELELYDFREDGAFHVKRAYPGISPSELDFGYRNYVFFIDILPRKGKTMYMKAKVSSDLYLVLKLWHPLPFSEMTRVEQLFLGIFSGIMLIMAFYNFFLYLSFKDTSYLYYIFFLLSLSILQLNNHHIITEWIPSLAQYEESITLIFKLLSFTGFLLFSKSFLSIRKYYPTGNGVLSAGICVVIGTGLLSFFFAAFKPLNSIFLAASGVMIIVFAAAILKKGNRTAVFFLIATAALIGFGVLVLIPAEALYVKSINFFLPYFIDLGSLLMIVLFSFGLGYRINTLRKEKEQADRLKDLDRAKSRFFANISHEFRTPLTLISGPLADMLSVCGDPDGKKRIEMMIRNTDRLLRLVNELLDLSKIESGKMKLSASEQNIVSFTKAMVDCFSHIADQNRQLLSYRPDQNEILVYFDVDKMEKVLLNLLINAIKFTPAGGEIVIRTEKETDPACVDESLPVFVRITVTNTGHGIPPEHLDRIFEHFYQAGNIREQAHKGSGIGLSLAKELVELHHGTIHSTSLNDDPGGNNLTEFTVRLPLGRLHFKDDEITQAMPAYGGFTLTRQVRDLCASDTLHRTRVEETGDASGTTGPEEDKREIILIIEDNDEVRAYVREGLEARFHILEARDGEEGIAKAKKTIPDLIISDVMLPCRDPGKPETDGFEVTRILKSGIDTSHIPVVLLTAKASEDSIIRGLEYGADDYITKPFNLKIVKTRVRNLIGLRRRLQEKIQKQLTMQPVELTIASIDRKFLHNLDEYIERNISDQDYGIDQLANDMNMSRATLNRKIRALAGQSTNQYVQSYRLKKAAQLLRSNFGNVTEVCFAVGFSSSAYFTKCFKESFHRLPSEYQAVAVS